MGQSSDTTRSNNDFTSGNSDRPAAACRRPDVSLAGPSIPLCEAVPAVVRPGGAACCRRLAFHQLVRYNLAALGPPPDESEGVIP